MIVGASQRPGSSFEPEAAQLNFSLLSDLKGVINFDAKIPDCAFEFGMPE